MAELRVSHTLMTPREELYANVLHWDGWHCTAVITSVNSSIFVGLISKMSENT